MKRRLRPGRRLISALNAGQKVNEASSSGTNGGGGGAAAGRGLQDEKPKSNEGTAAAREMATRVPGLFTRDQTKFNFATR